MEELYKPIIKPLQKVTNKISQNKYAQIMSRTFPKTCRKYIGTYPKYVQNIPAIKTSENQLLTTKDV